MVFQSLDAGIIYSIAYRMGQKIGRSQTKENKRIGWAFIIKESPRKG